MTRNPDTSTGYWKEVDYWEAESGYPRRVTFERSLPNGGILVLVRMADMKSESCTMTYVPPIALTPPTQGAFR